MILGGSGTVRIGDEEADVRAGHVVSRPAGHAARALVPRRRRTGSSTSPTASATATTSRTTRTRARSRSWGVGVIGRIEPLDYWHGEDEPA